MTQQYSFIVAGEKRTSGTAVPIINPYTGTPVGDLSLASRQDLLDGIAASAKSFPVLRSLAAFERADILSFISSEIAKQREDFALLIAMESGKPIRFARGEVDRAVSTFHIAAGEATRMSGEVLPLDVSASGRGKKGIVTRFPIGPIAAISPFNFPLNLVAHKLAPAIAVGNPAIVKPPPQAPLTSLLLGEVLIRSGLPRGSINILPCENNDAELLVTDERIAMVSFTGSARVGWELKKKSGKKKVVLELGGNAGVVVDEDADIPQTVDQCLLGGFAQAGQVCIKVQRIYVHQGIYDEFERRFVAAARTVVAGDPLSEATVVGPMISLGEAKRVEAWVTESVSQGARLLIGGARNGAMVMPTILTDVRPEMKVCREEVFGPVVTLHRVQSFDEGIDEVNNTRYGLQAAVFTKDLSNVMRAYDRLEVGGVIVNDYPTFRVDNMPYGGVKDSGFGREGVAAAIREMTEPRILVLDFH